MLASTPALARVEKIGKGEGAVDIVAWPGYIERGATDKDMSVCGLEDYTVVRHVMVNFV